METRGYECGNQGARLLRLASVGYLQLAGYRVSVLVGTCRALWGMKALPRRKVQPNVSHRGEEKRPPGPPLPTGAEHCRLSVAEAEMPDDLAY